MKQRRHFLAAASAEFRSSLRGVGDRVNAAMIGLGGRGMEKLKTAASLPDCHIAAVCDVYGGRCFDCDAELMARVGLHFMIPL